MPDVWAIDGVDVPAATARAVAHVAIGGASGVIEPSGLKVVPLEVPGGRVRVMPGAVAIASRYPGGALQSYAVHERVAQEIVIAATGSAGSRTDLVVARVVDPEFEEGATPGASFEVIQAVPPGTGPEFVETLTYPAEALARVTVPASTATITAGMITDLRRLARPRTSRVLREIFPPGGDLLTRRPSFQTWPAVTVPLDVPSWATHATCVVTLSAVQQITGVVGGDIRVLLGSIVGATSVYDLNDVVGTEDPARHVIQVTVSGDVRSVAGRRIEVSVQGNRAASGAPGALRSLAGTAMVVDVQFDEQTV